MCDAVHDITDQQTLDALLAYKKHWLEDNVNITGDIEDAKINLKDCALCRLFGFEDDEIEICVQELDCDACPLFDGKGTCCREWRDVARAKRGKMPSIADRQKVFHIISLDMVARLDELIDLYQMKVEAAHANKNQI